MKKLVIIVMWLVSLAAQGQFKAGRHFGFDTLEGGASKVLENCGIIHGKLFVSYYNVDGLGGYSTVVFDGNRVIAKWPFEFRVVHLPSGEYIIGNTVNKCPNQNLSSSNVSYYCWNDELPGTKIFKVMPDFTVQDIRFNLSTGIFYNLFQLGQTTYGIVQPEFGAVSEIKAFLYKLENNTWVRQNCQNFQIEENPRYLVVQNDTAYGIDGRVLAQNSCPFRRPWMSRFFDSTARNLRPIHMIFEDDTIFQIAGFDTAKYGLMVTSFLPNSTRPPDFIPMFQARLPTSTSSFWKTEQFVYFRSGFNARFSGLPEMQSSPLYVLENFKRGTRIFPIAVSEYDSSNFAGRLLDTTNGVSNRIVAIPASGFAGFVIHNDTLFLPGYPCTAPGYQKMCEAGGGPSPNNLYYIPVSTIMDSLGINRIVTRTKPKVQASNPNWRLFPNPAKELLQVAGLERGERFTLLNSQGRQVGSLSYPAKNIPINHLPKGMYVGVWQGAAGVKTEKVVVE